MTFFRGHTVSKEDLKRFGRRFGSLNVHPFLPKVDDDPEVLLLQNDRMWPPAVNVWHADMTFMSGPPHGAVLLARKIPDVGGDTLWPSMTATYEGPSDEMQSKLLARIDHQLFLEGVGSQNWASRVLTPATNTTRIASLESVADPQIVVVERRRQPDDPVGIAVRTPDGAQRALPLPPHVSNSAPSNVAWLGEYGVTPVPVRRDGPERKG